MTAIVIDMTQQPVAAGTTPDLSGQVQDAAGNALPASALFSFTVTIVDTQTRAVINSVSDVNVLNAGRGTVDSGGNFIIALQIADTALVFPLAHQTEYRSFILVWTWNGGTSRGAVEVKWVVASLAGT